MNLATWILFAQGYRGSRPPSNDAGSTVASAIVLVIELTLLALILVSWWVMFTRAGKPGWAAIIPIYNAIVILEIIGKPIWWIIFLFIPCVNIIFSILVNVELAEVFGNGTGFAVGLILLPFIFIPMLASGDAKYQGPAAETSY